MNCGICGGQMVLIRGRYPNTGKREVCPTCLAERMDQIRDISDKDYGKSYQAPLEIRALRPEKKGRRG